ncbi:MAG: type II toxin-antitoxin system RelE/ParE family toxin [Gammaproteobacteria bacterium]|nr:type II toxin-antitoxin system RelE/ParE family toxin [Gammaproteobacteria bacterium]
MTLEVRLRPEAEQDLSDAATWYEQQLPGLGHQFLDEVIAMLSLIADTPLLYPQIHRNTRRALIQRFPFGVYYRTENSIVVVLAVMHGSRDPHRWKIRT